ncbi:uncharacterized protein M8220_006509 isoform 2-T2 [Acridotheres tristis]
MAGTRDPLPGDSIVGSSVVPAAPGDSLTHSSVSLAHRWKVPRYFREDKAGRCQKLKCCNSAKAEPISPAPAAALVCAVGSLAREDTELLLAPAVQLEKLHLSAGSSATRVMNLSAAGFEAARFQIRSKTLGFTCDFCCIIHLCSCCWLLWHIPIPAWLCSAGSSWGQQTYKTGILTLLPASTSQGLPVQPWEHGHAVG